ncbi:MAG: hypothetical protein HY709_04030 [Candidatus Latescibacteria bacterium]|nr:hypothetical protein [Candidatus Latescibacterota bacterium]
MNLPSSRWPFFLLSLSFATIGWWMATTTFPSVWHYLHLRPRTFPLFDGIILCLSTFAGLGSTIYALRLLFQGSSVAPSLPP